MRSLLTEIQRQGQRGGRVQAAANKGARNADQTRGLAQQPAHAAEHCGLGWEGFEERATGREPATPCLAASTLPALRHPPGEIDRNPRN